MKERKKKVGRARGGARQAGEAAPRCPSPLSTHPVPLISRKRGLGMHCYSCSVSAVSLEPRF